MSISSISFMSAKPSKAVIKEATKKAEELKEQAMFYGKEPIGDIKKEASHRISDLKSYMDSHQQVIKENSVDKISGDEIAQAYKAAHGIV